MQSRHEKFRRIGRSVDADVDRPTAKSGIADSHSKCLSAIKHRKATKKSNTFEALDVAASDERINTATNIVDLFSLNKEKFSVS